MSASTALSNTELSSLSERGGTAGDRTAATVDIADILAASRLADSNVPDGGQGWVVLFGAAVLCFWFVGTSYSWGIIQAALVAEQISSPTTLSFVGSLWVAMLAILAVLNARLIRAIGAQRTGMLGISLLGLGELASSFTTQNIAGLFFTTGVVMGVGTSQCFMVVSTVPAQWFSRKRGLANGIVYAAGGLGGTILSFVLNGLIIRLGVAWTFRITSFLTLATGLPAAYLVKERTPITATTIIDRTLLREPRFFILFLAGALATFPLFVPPFFLPLYATSLGLSSNAGAGLVAGFNFSSAVGRLVLGLNADIIGPLNTLLLSLVVSGLSMLVIWPVSNSLGPLIAFVIGKSSGPSEYKFGLRTSGAIFDRYLLTYYFLINGVANGGFFAVMPTVVSSVFGSRRVSVAMGMIVSGWTFGYLLGAPIAGFLLAAYGGQAGGLVAYHPAIFYAGSMALAASALVAFVRFNISLSFKKRL